MSLAALLNLGKKEEPKKDKKDEVEEPPIPPIEDTPAILQRSKEESQYLNEYIGKQSQLSLKAREKEEKERAREENEREAARKRVLEDAAQQAAKRAKRQKIEADLSLSDGKLCKFYFMAGTSNAGCRRGDQCPYSHDPNAV